MARIARLGSGALLIQRTLEWRAAMSYLRQTQSRPRTVSRAASTPHCSSGLRRPTRSPSRRTSTAPTCSTNTLVCSPSTSITGRNDAARALREVGAIKTTDLGRSASDWTTTPYRRPCCSCPTPLGSRSARTSPLRTQLLHQLGDGERLGPIRLVRFESGGFLGESPAIPETIRSLHERYSDRFRSTQAGRFEGTERSERLVIQANRDGLRHACIVTRSVIRLKGLDPEVTIAKHTPLIFDSCAGVEVVPRPAGCVYAMRMARVNVYLPDELAAQAKAAGLNVSGLTQEAIRSVLAARRVDDWLDDVASLPPLDIDERAVAAAVSAAKDEFASRG